MGNKKEVGRLVIGGITGGMGRAIAKGALSRGWQVAGFARGEVGLEEFSGAYPGVQVVSLDARDSAAVKAGIGGLIDRLGGVDRYVHAIGSIALKAAHQVRDEEWREVMATNFDSAFYCLREMTSVMRNKGGGSIVFFSSVAARIGLANHEAIAAAKAGIEGMARAAAATYAGSGIRVNVIAPGLVDTPAAARFLANEVTRQMSERMHPLGRIGTADEVASLALWLLSNESGWVTGQTFSMDGGMSTILTKPKA